MAKARVTFTLTIDCEDDHDAILAEADKLSMDDMRVVIDDGTGITTAWSVRDIRQSVAFNKELEAEYGSK